jgi:hypothetical protein
MHEQRARVARQREAHFEAYHAWEYERRLYDEITDIAERVRAPISPTQEFTLGAEGLVSARGESLRPIIAKGLAEAQRMAITNDDWRVEVVRRTIDLEEYDALETLAFEGEGAGALVSYWLIPDVVRVDGSTLPGYNRERLKMFTRVAVPTANGIAIKYHSYDHSYLPGVQAMDGALGFTFDASRNSEQIASDRRRIEVPVESVDALDEILRQAYDGAMALDFGGDWFGGRRPMAVTDVVGLISAQDGLLREHMGELARVFALSRDPHERNKLMEPHRYNLAAAIDDLLHGKTVTSAGEAGDGARAEGRNLDGDCATSKDNAVDQLGSLGFKSGKKQERMRIWVDAECIACLKTKAVAANECRMCLDCEEVHNTFGNTGLGVIMREAKERRVREERLARKRKKATGKAAVWRVLAQPSDSLYTGRR